MELPKTLSQCPPLGPYTLNQIGQAEIPAPPQCECQVRSSRPMRLADRRNAEYRKYRSHIEEPPIAVPLPQTILSTRLRAGSGNEIKTQKWHIPQGSTQGRYIHTYTKTFCTKEQSPFREQKERIDHDKTFTQIKAKCRHSPCKKE